MSLLYSLLIGLQLWLGASAGMNLVGRNNTSQFVSVYQGSFQFGGRHVVLRIIRCISQLNTLAGPSAFTERMYTGCRWWRTPIWIWLSMKLLLLASVLFAHGLSTMLPARRRQAPTSRYFVDHVFLRPSFNYSVRFWTRMVLRQSMKEQMVCSGLIN